MDREDEKAFESMEQAEQFLRNAEGNQFFAYRIFRESRMKLFRRMGCMDLYQQEKELLEDRERQDQAAAVTDALTGIYNRAGMYETLRNLEFEIQQKGCPREAALEELAKEIYRKIGNANGFQGQIENYLGHEVEMDSKRLITCSLGIAADSKVQNEEDFNKMIRRADDRMYSVKTGTKGHYSFI